MVPYDLQYAIPRQILQIMGLELTGNVLVIRPEVTRVNHLRERKYYQISMCLTAHQTILADVKQSCDTAKIHISIIAQLNNCLSQTSPVLPVS